VLKDKGILWSADFGDNRLLTSSSDKTSKLWDVPSSECVQTLRGHTNVVYSARLSTDGRLVASASRDETAKIWNLASGACIRTLSGHGGTVTAVAFSPDGRLVATACADQTAKIWSVGSGACIRTLTGHHKAVNSVDFSPDGRLITTAADDRTVRVWDVNMGECGGTWRGHEGGVCGASFSPHGRLVASASDDKTAMIWDANDFTVGVVTPDEWRAAFVVKSKSLGSEIIDLEAAVDLCNELFRGRVPRETVKSTLVRNDRGGTEMIGEQEFNMTMKKLKQLSMNN